MPNAQPAEAHAQFWSGYPVVHDAAGLVAQLETMLPTDAAIAVVPCAPLQELDDRRGE